MRRYIIDTTGNYVFFVPLVGLVNWLISGWTWETFTGYAIGSVIIAACTGRSFTWFLANVWYPLWDRIWKPTTGFFSLWVKSDGSIVRRPSV